MALFSLTSIVSLLVLSYLSSFILFAVLRIATGISIQRLGFTSLRHVSYSPREGLRIDIRGLGLHVHRPTFAQPTWVSLRFQELHITLDPEIAHRTASARPEPATDKNDSPQQSKHRRKKSEIWNRLTRVKERLKDIHHKIGWLRLLDFYAVDSCLDVVGVGTVSIGSITLAVHTRRKLLDRGRLFRHKKFPSGNQRPAEWIFTLRGMFLAVSGRDPIEIMDAMTVNVHGLLYANKHGLRDTSIAMKIGRLHVPLDDLLLFQSQTPSQQQQQQQQNTAFASSHEEKISLDDVVDELERPGSREAAIVQTVADSKEFLSSVLSSVQEIQIGLSFLRVSKEIVALRQANLPVTMNAVTHEIGVDLHRLPQGEPAHRMYFNHDDVAHQALLAAVSMSVSLDEDDASTNRILYVPMATTTMRTTLPSKTMSYQHERGANDRNTNVVFANLVITSPAFDFTPRQLEQLLALASSRRSNRKQPPPSRHRIISRLLPRSSIKLSIQEPVVRFVLPVAGQKKQSTEDYDMIISSISSVSLDVESSHSVKEDLLYSLLANFRLANHKLYYQACTGGKHNLVMTDSLDIESRVTVSDNVYVVVSGSLRNLSIFVIHSEVSHSIYNIVRHFRRRSQISENPKPDRHQSLIRKIPPWLLELHLEGTNLSIETAGTDPSVSRQSRGVALELESWTVDYLAHRDEPPQRPLFRRKKSVAVRRGNDPGDVTHLSPPSNKHWHHNVTQTPTDGRRFTTHIKGFQGFIIESLEHWEQSPFLSIPRVELTVSTSRDSQGLTCHLNSFMRSFFLDFSLYRVYSVGLAAIVIQDALQGPNRTPRSQEKSKPPDQPNGAHVEDGDPSPIGELIAVDIKAGYIQIKAHLPHDPALMLQIYNVAAGQHRWSAPFLRSQLIRLHATSPSIRTAWARLIGISNIRLDLRKTKKKHPHGTVEENSIEVTTDFVRIGVPHSLQMFKVFDNFVNTFKTMLQLMHRLKTRSNEYILHKGPERPKQLPRISIRSKALMFELEDDAFEHKLGTIYHVGRNEQRQRMAREEAFRSKVKKMQDKRGRSSSAVRARSSHPASNSTPPRTPERRSLSQDSTPHRRSRSRGRAQKPRMLRYDRDGACCLTNDAHIQADEAWDRLQEYNAKIWKARIDWVTRTRNSSIEHVRRIFWGADEPPPEMSSHETILSIPNRYGLLTIVISDLHLVIDKPSFPLSDLPDFLFDIGKGLPKDTQYALLIPMHLALDMGEAKFMLRDYPLSLLHIPAIKAGQSARLPAWSLDTDFVIAEEYRNEDSIRHVNVEIVPKGQRLLDGTEIPGFGIDVPRTVSPVKTYSKPVININAGGTTSITWANSYQPAIQDVMMIIETFTKPELDPSDRVGFWDKIRLSFHSRPIISWKGDGDVQLRLKGSRDPYIITGLGAGFVMCWRNDVRWAVHETDDPKEFMTVKSGEYVLAIPDYSAKASSGPLGNSRHDSDSVSSANSAKNTALFSKVIMKVSGKVQWTAGLVFTRDTPDGQSTSQFTPHYKVVLRNPKTISESDLKSYDAFKGFRSHNIHMSITLRAPVDRKWATPQLGPSTSYNSVHLTPRFFSHFYAWWDLFSGVMSLPIRQGPLWRGPEQSSKKFGRHLATIKYQLLLSPLFIAHVYKHKETEDYDSDIVSVTGIKLKLDSFLLDIHQRREWFDTMSKNKNEQSRTSAMRINSAELDFINADLRAVAAEIEGTTAHDLKRATDDMLASYGEPSQNIDLSRFTIPDQDYSWIDMDDFVELDWILPANMHPATKFLPLAFTPRFTYFRQTDHGNAIHGDVKRTSPFGKEDTHHCIMQTHHNDPREVQMQLVTARLEHLESQMKQHRERMEEHELKLVRAVSKDNSLVREKEIYEIQMNELHNKKEFLETGLERLEQRQRRSNTSLMPGGRVDRTENEGHSLTPDGSNHLNEDSVDGNDDHMNMHDDSELTDEFASDFNNRFIIHNAQLKWNNDLRNIILRYSHQVSQRRGFVYYMSRKAVKFILDIVDEQAKKTQARQGDLDVDRDMPSSFAAEVKSPTDERDEDELVQERIKQLLDDANKFVSTDDVDKDVEHKSNGHGSSEEIADDFLALNGYNIRLIAPQIQLQSEKNTSSAVLLTTKGMQLRVIAIVDKEHISDEVSGLVQRRFSLDMDGVQIFVTDLKRFSQSIHLYPGNRYGNAPKAAWPPWCGIETMFDFQIDPFGFQRVVQKTSASLRYEKYNPLRLKYNEEVGGKRGQRKRSNSESGIDHLWVDFPRLRASCDSKQYYAMYMIVMDLLLYSEPLEKTRTEKLEKIMLASDFSDLRGAPEMAENLQGRIRQLYELKNQFIINARHLDKQGWQDRIDLEKDLVTCEDELFFIMKAINTSQQRNDDRNSQSSGFLRWYLSSSQIVWHLMQDKDQPLLEFQLGNATYERIDNSDGSNHNALEIDHIRGFNLLPDAIYPDIFGPFDDPQNKQSKKEPKMLQLHWFMLEAIAGITVLEDFEVSLHPLRVQLERTLGRALFEYIFPGARDDNNDSSSSLPSPLVTKQVSLPDQSEDDELEKARNIVCPEEPPHGPSKDELSDASPGGISSRLQPTHNFKKVSGKNAVGKSKGLGLGTYRFGLFRHKDPPPHQTLVRQGSEGSLRSVKSKRDDRQGSVISLQDGSSSGLTRAESRDRRNLRFYGHANGDTKDRSKKHVDDVSQMVARASNYTTLAHVKMNSFVICLSYKGERERNLVDLHDFVFRMPALEYSNKTWSNLDLAMHVKKDVIRALVSHTGAIIGNKFSHHRPGKRQVEKWREKAAHLTLVPNSDTLANTPSISSGNSLFTDSESRFDYRTSFQSDRSSRHDEQGLQPSPLPDTNDRNGHGRPTPRQYLAPRHANGSQSSSSLVLRTGELNGPTRPVVSAGNSPLSPVSPPRIDPLGPISSVFNRPSTSGSFIPGKSLLKDVVGRHLSLGSNSHSDNTGESNGTIRPVIHKGRVRFTSKNSSNSVKTTVSPPSKPESSPSPHSRSMSDITLDRTSSTADEEDGSPGSPETEKGIPSSIKRKGMMFLGKKVLNSLGNKDKS